MNRTLATLPRHSFQNSHKAFGERSGAQSKYAVPEALGVLWAIVEKNRDIASPEIVELVTRIHRWLKGDGARMSMNKSFAASRNRSPEKLPAMIAWLERADVESHFLEQAAKQAHTALHMGLIRIHRGELASVAFDEGSPNHAIGVMTVHALAANSPNAMLLVKVGGKVVYANGAAEQMFGFTNQELLDRGVDELVPHRIRGNHGRLREGFFHKRQHRAMGADGELFAINKYGREFPVEISLNPLAMDNGDFVFATIVDATKRHRREKRKAVRALVMQRLSEHAATEELLQLILSTVTDEAPNSASAVLMPDVGKESLVCAAAHGFAVGGPHVSKCVPIGPAAPPCGQVLRSREELAIDQIAVSACRDSCPTMAAQAGYSSCRLVPLMSTIGAQVLGVLAFCQRPTIDVQQNGADSDWAEWAVSLAAFTMAHKRLEDELEIANSVLNGMDEAVAVIDNQNRIVAVNPAFTKLTGYGPNEVIGHKPQLFGSGLHGPSFYEEMCRQLAITGQWSGEIWHHRKDGEVLHEWLSIKTIYGADDKVIRRLATFSKVTDQKRAGTVISHQADYDSLTGLPNRRLFLERLQCETGKSGRSRSSLALLFIDLDRFKEVNDTLGHSAGDGILVEAAKRISACVRSTDTVARLGDDEFTIIMSDLSEIDRVRIVAQSINDALSIPFSSVPDDIHVSASIGITICPADARVPDDLIKNADQAMYAAKSRGRNCFSYFTGSVQPVAQTGRLL